MWPAPITAMRSALTPRLACARRDADDRDAGGVGLAQRAPRARARRVRPGLDREHARAPPRRSAASVSGPIAGTSKRGSCCGLRHLHHARAPRRERAAAADRRVGALDRLDRQHRAVLAPRRSGRCRARRAPCAIGKPNAMSARCAAVGATAPSTPSPRQQLRRERGLRQQRGARAPRACARAARRIVSSLRSRERARSASARGVEAQRAGVAEEQPLRDLARPSPPRARRAARRRREPAADLARRRSSVSAVDLALEAGVGELVAKRDARPRAAARGARRAPPRAGSARCPAIRPSARARTRGYRTKPRSRAPRNVQQARDLAGAAHSAATRAQRRLEAQLRVEQQVEGVLDRGDALSVEAAPLEVDAVHARRSARGRPRPARRAARPARPSRCRR